MSGMAADISRGLHREDCARDDARRQLDLEGVGGAVHGEHARRAHRRLVQRVADQGVLDRERPPGLRGDAADADAQVADGAAIRLHLQPNRRARRGEFVGFPVAYLEVMGSAQRGRDRDLDSDDQLAGLQREFEMGRVARQQEEVLRRDLASRAVLHIHDGVEGDQRHREVAGMGGDAGVADAEHGVAAVDALHRRAAGAGVPLVAVGIGVRLAEVAAAGPLQQVAADSRHVAELLRRASPERLRQNGEGLADQRVVGDLAHPCQRPDADARLVDLDAGQPRKTGDVHERRRRLDPALHEVEHRRPAGEEARAGLAGDGPHRIGDRGGPQVPEAVHGAAPIGLAIAMAASRTAATMFG
jgi:hypothetical protein